MPKKKAAQETTLKTVKDVEFYYTSVTFASKNFIDAADAKTAMSDNPLELHSYEVKIAVTEAVFKNLKKTFKGAKNFPHAKEFTPEEFMEYFKTDKEPEEDMVLIKFATTCLKGPATARVPSTPIVQIGICGRVQDRNGNSIDQDTQLGNGTKGHFQFRPAETKGGLYLYPVAICVTELVEYAGGNSVDEDAFGMEGLKEVAAEPDSSSDFDDDIAF